MEQDTETIGVTSRMDNTIRIQKLLSDQGVLSRRRTE